MSGPFLQHEPYPGSETYRWGIKGEGDARAKVRLLKNAGVDVIKLIDQDEMTMGEVRAVVDEAHKNGLKVVAHAHRAEEIRRGLEAGVDCFEHTGLGTSPEYPPDIMAMLRKPRQQPLLDPHRHPAPALRIHPRQLPSGSTIRIGTKACRPKPSPTCGPASSRPQDLEYFKLVPKRRPTVARKFAQLRETGVILLIGTDSGVPLTFHSDSTWRELGGLGGLRGGADGRDPRRHLLAGAFARRCSTARARSPRAKMPTSSRCAATCCSHIDLLQDVDLVIKGGKQVK